MSIRVAVVEDNSFLVRSILDKLSFFDDIIVKHIAKNGKDILKKLSRDHNIDVILMDIQMPEMDGIEATEIVNSKYPQIKIIMLTVFDDDEYIFNSIQAGASGYLLKEANPDFLYESIRNVLSGGATMTPCIALKTLQLLRNPDRTKYDDNYRKDFELSQRQIEILTQLSKGLNYIQIADNLFISPGTVRKHIENIYKALKVHSKMEAVQKATKHGII